MNYKKELDLLKNNIKSIYQDVQTKTFETSFKGTQDIVTSTDLTIEKMIVSMIKEVFPNDHFHTEEYYNETVLKDRTWVIDPIDGTSNYAVHMGLFVVQIALFDQGDIVLSYVYAPELNHTYYAVKGEGAYFNDCLYHVDDQVQATNFMVSMVGITQENNDKTYYYKLLEFTKENNYKLRMLGSIGLELAMASKGIFDVFYSNVTNIWDIYPGILLLREAGALLLNKSGHPYQLGQDIDLFACKNQSVKDILFDGMNRQ